MAHLQTIEPLGDGLYPMYLHPDSGSFTSQIITLGARADSLYEYLLKQYLLAGGIRQASVDRLRGAWRRHRPKQRGRRMGGGIVGEDEDRVAGLHGLRGNGALLWRAQHAEAGAGSVSGASVPKGSPARGAWAAAGAVAGKEAAGDAGGDADKGQGEGAVAVEHGAAHPLYACSDAQLAPCTDHEDEAKGEGQGEGQGGNECTQALRRALAAACTSSSSPSPSTSLAVAGAGPSCRAFPWYAGIGAQAAAPSLLGPGTACPPSTSLIRRLDASLSEASWFASLLGMYWRSMAGIDAHLMRHGKPDGVAFITERHGPGHWDDKMDHLVCFVPGMLALGSLVAPTPTLRARHMRLARELTATCIRMYGQQPSGLAPEISRSMGGGDPVADPGAKHNLLRPETVESLLIMWRVTGEGQYREAGRRILDAFNRHSRVEGGGYSTLRDVTMDRPEKTDNQESFFLAETLKYLLLLFADSSAIPLDQWVFNTEAHPLPVF